MVKCQDAAEPIAPEDIPGQHERRDVPRTRLGKGGLHGQARHAAPQRLRQAAIGAERAERQPARARAVATYTRNLSPKPVCVQAQALKRRHDVAWRVAIHTIASLPGVPLSH